MSRLRFDGDHMASAIVLYLRYELGSDDSSRYGALRRELPSPRVIQNSVHEPDRRWLVPAVESLFANRTILFLSSSFCAPRLLPG